LHTSKINHFNAWCKVIDLVLTKRHLTLDGLEEIVALKGCFPKGLNETLKATFLHVKVKEYPEFFPSTLPLDGNWVAGFVNADGSFSLGKKKDPKGFFGLKFACFFSVSQHNRDLHILNKIANIFAQGRIIPEAKDCFQFQITGAKNIGLGPNSVLNFFKNYPLHGVNYLDFNDFHLGINMLLKKEHLTSKGVNILIRLASGMNSYRK